MGSNAVRLPDFLVIGAPKAGTSALHTTLAAHPDLAMSSPKEPKYFLCGDAPPPYYTGPGDRHSRKEWIWRREDYGRLFAGVSRDRLCGESTPFYLFDFNAHRRMADLIPHAKLVAVLRDPVDRAYSNWMHLWADGLEPVGDVVEACRREEARVHAGWAPFWRYTGLGRYGAQLAHLYRYFPPEQVMVLRYRELVDEPQLTLDRVCAFLHVDKGTIADVAPDNTRPFVHDGPRTRMFSWGLRAGARLGAAFEPQLWRQASRPLLRALHRQGTSDRPRLRPDQRRTLIDRHFADDITLLESVTSRSFADWRGETGSGGYATRAQQRLAS